MSKVIRMIFKIIYQKISDLYSYQRTQAYRCQAFILLNFNEPINHRPVTDVIGKAKFKGQLCLMCVTT